jgi:hypothetical protein
MALVIVERAFETPVTFDEMRAQGARFGWCLDQHGVRFLRSYLAADGLRMICLYEAPDAESVRQVNRQAGMPFERVWTTTLHGPQSGL